MIAVIAPSNGDDLGVGAAGHARPSTRAPPGGADTLIYNCVLIYGGKG
jgi:hypothetical protein